MVRHQTIHHQLDSHNSAIPHPCCPRHPRSKIARHPSRRSPAQPGAVPARRFARLRPRVSAPRPRTTHFDLNNPTIQRNIHTHHQRCPPPSTRFLNGTTPTPAWTEPSRCINTIQVNYKYTLRSRSINTMRFFLDPNSGGFLHSHSLLCFSFSQTRAILSCIVSLSSVHPCSASPFRFFFFDHGPR